MLTILWVIAAILIILWIIGLVGHILGGFIHILIIVAIILIIWSFVTRNR